MSEAAVAAKADRKARLKNLYECDRHTFWGTASFREARKHDDKLTYDQFCDAKLKHWTDNKKAGPPKARIHVPKATSVEEAAELKAAMERTKAKMEAQAARIKEFEESQKPKGAKGK